MLLPLPHTIVLKLFYGKVFSRRNWFSTRIVIIFKSENFRILLVSHKIRKWSKRILAKNTCFILFSKIFKVNPLKIQQLNFYLKQLYTRAVGNKNIQKVVFPYSIPFQQEEHQKTSSKVHFMLDDQG